MNLFFAGQTFTDKLIHAFFWTLVHSLWQGMLLALLAGLVLLSTKRSAPVLRYRILSGLFLAFIVAVCGSFAWQWQTGLGASDPIQEVSARQNANLQGGLKQVSTPVSGLSSKYINVDAGSHLINGPGLGTSAPYVSGQGLSITVAASGPLSFFDRVSIYCNSHAYLVVMIWFVLFSVRCLKIGVNLGAMQRLRRHGIQDPPAYWKSRVKELAYRLHINRHIELLESEIAKVPMMVGFLKPVILMPIGLLMQLPADQVEAVLLHELAHIRRKDYLVNILQHFAEIIFFFNPGVLWLSSLLRDEREHCCDDMAIGETNNKQQFIHALVSFQEYQLSGSSYTMSFPGPQKGRLLQRVKRIIYNDNKTLDIREKVFLAACLFITGALTLAFSQSGQVAFASLQAHGKTGKSSGTGVKADTVPVRTAFSGGSNGGYSGDFPILKKWSEGKEGIKRGGREGDTVTYYSMGYEIITRDTALMAVYYQGVRIPDERIVDYVELIDKIILKENLRLSENRVSPDMGPEQAARDAKLAVLERQQAEKDVEQAALNRQQMELNGQDEDRVKDEADRRKMEADRIKMEEDRKKMEADLSNANFNQDFPMMAPVPPVPSGGIPEPPVPTPPVPSVGVPVPRVHTPIPPVPDYGNGDDTLPGAGRSTDEEIRKFRDYQKRLEEKRALLNKQQQQLNEEYASLGEETAKLAAQRGASDEELIKNFPFLEGITDSAERRRFETMVRLNVANEEKSARELEESIKRQNMTISMQERTQEQAMVRQAEAIQRMNEAIKLRAMREQESLRRQQGRDTLQLYHPSQTYKPLPPYQSRQPLQSVQPGPLIKPRPPIRPSVNPIVRIFISELLLEKIITDTSDLSFTFNADELIVNGVKQSAAVYSKFNKFKEEYFKAPDSGIIYSRRGSSIGTTTHNIKVDAAQ